MQAKTVGTLGKNVLTRSGWSEAEEELLREKLSGAAHAGTPLREVFDLVAVETGRKPNSVRNYYYTALRSHIAGQEEPALVRRERSGFTPFTDEEIRTLLRDVLTLQAQGLSVRACALKLGEGDRSRMLRYQNKYRSLVRNRRTLVEDVMRTLEREGASYCSPYGDEPELDEAAEAMSEERRDARSVVSLIAQETGVNLIDLVNTLNALTARLGGDDTTRLRHRAEAAEERADRAQTRLRTLCIAVRDYLTTLDPARLPTLRALIEEMGTERIH